MPSIKEVARAAAISAAITVGTVGCADSPIRPNATTAVTQAPQSDAPTSEYNPVDDVRNETVDDTKNRSEGVVLAAAGAGIFAIGGWVALRYVMRRPKKQ